MPSSLVVTDLCPASSMIPLPIGSGQDTIIKISYGPDIRRRLHSIDGSTVVGKDLKRRGRRQRRLPNSQTFHAVDLVPRETSRTGQYAIVKKRRTPWHTDKICTMEELRISQRRLWMNFVRSFQLATPRLEALKYGNKNGAEYQECLDYISRTLIRNAVTSERPFENKV